MPTATRRQAQASPLDRTGLGLSSDHVHDHSTTDISHMDVHQLPDEDELVEDLEADDSPFPPPGLKEVSSLASWTVSTAKPGNGVSALRSPDTNLYWQSDGPQPHLLSIHFFRLMSLVHMRIFLDFEADESYTPTKIQFLAGMGVYDLQEFAEMSFESPSGWIEVDFSNVGPSEEDGEVDGDELRPTIESGEIDWSKRPVLRAFLVQVRILENHQNGKDTHLRAVQLFARDDGYVAPMRGGMVAREKAVPVRLSPKKPRRGKAIDAAVEDHIKLASWMTEPDMR